MALVTNRSISGGEPVPGKVTFISGTFKCELSLFILTCPKEVRTNRTIIAVKKSRIIIIFLRDEM